MPTNGISIIRPASNSIRKGVIRGETNVEDDVIVTDDNPRGEDAAKIRSQAMAGCPNAQEIGDRAKAIRAGVTALRAGDVLVVAGKGHETGQIVGDQTLPFHDGEAVREAVRHWEAGAA